MNGHETEAIQDPITLEWFQLCECQIEQRPQELGDRLLISNFGEGCPNQ